MFFDAGIALPSVNFDACIMELLRRDANREDGVLYNLCGINENVDDGDADWG